MASEQWSEEAECESIRTVVIRAHPQGDPSQLELQVNDIVMVLEKDDSGWWGGHKEGDDFTGWFPGNCVRALPQGVQHPDHSAGQHSERAGSTTTASRDEPEVASKINPRNSALETDISSPVRQNHAVASPQRPSLAVGQGALSMTPATAEAAGAACRRASVIDDSQSVEVEQLKRENMVLAETLKKVQRQSDVDRRNYNQVERNYNQVEAAKDKLEKEKEEYRKEKEELSRYLEDERSRAKRLEEQLRQKDRDLEYVKRTSVTVQAVPVASPPPPSPSPMPKEEAEPRRRLFNSMTNPAGATAAMEDSRLTVTASPSPEQPRGRSAYSASPSPPLPAERLALSYRPAESSGSSAMVRASSSSSIRPEEEPPSGVVKQMRDAIESRTPRRSASQTSVRSSAGQERGSRSAVARQPVVFTAPLQMNARSGARFPPRPIATDRPVQEEKYGLEPIDRAALKEAHFQRMSQFQR